MADITPRLRFYRILLRLYPLSYRTAYEDQMVQTLTDMLDDTPNGWDRLFIWTRVVIDFPAALFKEHISYMGGIVMHDTPRYIKRNALVSAILLLPFVFALLSNALHEAISGQPLYHSWLWQKPILGIWVLYLPFAAACIGLATWLLFLVGRIQSKRQPWFYALLDIRYTWPLILVSGAGLFILAVVFGHDSVHCIIGSPVREVQQWHQTWQCIQQD